MLRFYVIATVIVVVAGVVAAAFHRSGGDVRVASVQSTASPSPPRVQAASTFTPGPLTGDAPWVLSALVDCFHQERTFGGALSSVAKHIPKHALQLEREAILTSGPCRVEAGQDDARVVRGPSNAPSVEARIPPHVRLFVAEGPPELQATGRRQLYVLRWTSESRARVDRLSTEADARIVPCCKG